VAWYLVTSHPGSRLVILALAVLASSALISYQRAKAESLGLDARGGLMERAERIIALAVGLAFHVLLVPVLWVMLGLTLFTAVQRFVKVWVQASAPRDVDRPVSRWRNWRPMAGVSGQGEWRRRRPRRADRSRASSTWRRRAHTRP
jgi:CDP-diacylglycerol--glycerol-3-phosphate 3-phosphatidyltransferase